MRERRNQKRAERRWGWLAGLAVMVAAGVLLISGVGRVLALRENGREIGSIGELERYLSIESEEYEPGGKYVLTADLDVTGREITIGDNVEPFVGELDGAGHEIKGLSRPLFGKVGQGAKIENLVVEGTIREGELYGAGEGYIEGYGLLAAHIEGAEIRNVGAVGEIEIGDRAEREVRVRKGNEEGTDNNEEGKGNNEEPGKSETGSNEEGTNNKEEGITKKEEPNQPEQEGNGEDINKEETNTPQEPEATDSANPETGSNGEGTNKKEEGITNKEEPNQPEQGSNGEELSKPEGTGEADKPEEPAVGEPEPVVDPVAKLFGPVKAMAAEADIVNPEEDTSGTGEGSNVPDTTPTTPDTGDTGAVPQPGEPAEGEGTGTPDVPEVNQPEGPTEGPATEPTDPDVPTEPEAPVDPAPEQKEDTTQPEEPTGDEYIRTTAEEVYAGGLIGVSEGESLIQNCYAFVKITKKGNETAAVAGGFIGVLKEGGRIENSYATGSVEGAAVLGGFAGINEGGIGACYVSNTLGAGEERGAFAGRYGESASAKECAYDYRMSCGEDKQAQRKGTEELTGIQDSLSGEWHYTEGAYPQLPYFALNEKIEIQKKSKASAIALQLGSGTIEGVEGEIELVQEIEGEAVEWSVSGDVRLTEDGKAVIDLNEEPEHNTNTDSLGKDTPQVYSTRALEEPVPEETIRIEKSGTITANIDGVEKTFQLYASTLKAGKTINIYTSSDWKNYFYNLTSVISGPIEINIMADLDFSDISFVAFSEQRLAFSGTINGNGHVISNTSYPLIGVMESATIRDLKIENVNVNKGSSTSYRGALVEEILPGSVSSIINCRAEGNITYSGEVVGGLIGSVAGTPEARHLIQRCSSAMTVMGTSRNVGSLIGSGENITIQNCTADSNISITSKLSKDQYSGGIIGKMISSEMKDCTARGSITYSYQTVTTLDCGGLIGLASDVNVSNSKSSTVIKLDQLTGGTAKAGGLIGELLTEYEGTFADNQLTKCLSEGSIQLASSYAGGLIGYALGNKLGDVVYRNLMTDCQSETDILLGKTSSGAQAGGLIGYCQYAQIENCSAIGDVSGNTAGGLIETCYDTEIGQSFSAGNVLGRSGDAAGLITNISGGSIDSSYSMCNVTGSSCAAGFLGTVNGESLTVNNCYAVGMLTRNIMNTSKEGIFIGYISDAAAINKVSNCYSACTAGKKGAVFSEDIYKFAIIKGDTGTGKVENIYTDYQLLPCQALGTEGGISSCLTPQMLGSEMKFTDASAWNFTEGYYPQLKVFTGSSGYNPEMTAAYSQASAIALSLDASETAFEVSKQIGFQDGTPENWTTTGEEGRGDYLKFTDHTIEIYGGDGESVGAVYTIKEGISKSFGLFPKIRGIKITCLEDWEKYFSSYMTQGARGIYELDFSATGGRADFSKLKESAGNYDYSFNGIILGNGQTIYGLNKPLFDYIGAPYIENLYLETAEEGIIVDNADESAGILARRQGGSVVRVGSPNIIGCRVKGKIEGKQLNSRYTGIGGFIGYSSNNGTSTLILEDCSGDVTIKGFNSLGGLVGAGTFQLINCRATGEIQGLGDWIGGLAGKGSKIENSWFSGTVTGQNYVGGLAGDGSVSNSYTKEKDTCEVTGKNYVGGLVGQGTVTQSYSSCEVTGNDYVGGLAGKGTVTQSYSISEVTGKNYVGGLIGYGNAVNGSSADGSYFNGIITGVENVGGISGTNSGTISNCYATGIINGSKNVGGILGRNGMGSSKLALDTCYSTCNIRSAGSNIGGVVGDLVTTPSTNIANLCYFDKQMAGTNLGAGNSKTAIIKPCTTDWMIDAVNASAAGFTEEKGWTITEGSYPQLSVFSSSENEEWKAASLVSAIPIRLSSSDVSAASVSGVISLPNLPGVWSSQREFVLTIQDNMQAIPKKNGDTFLVYTDSNGLKKCFGISVVTGEILKITNLEEWDSCLGSGATAESMRNTYILEFPGNSIDFTGYTLSSGTSQQLPFSGKIDGNNQTITNLSNSLFRYLKGAQISDLTLTGALQINQSATKGLLADYVLSGAKSDIQNCHVSGSIEGTFTEETGDIGGLIGYISDTSAGRAHVISGCSANMVIRLKGGACAGILIGQGSYLSLVEGCYAEGTITADGVGKVGGMAGYLSSVGRVTGCGSNVTIQSTGHNNQYSGGLAGVMSGTAVSRCFSLGKVFSSVTGGGLIGSGNSVTADQCYANCKVLGESKEAGGFIGYAGSCTISNSYSVGTVESLSGYAGGFAAGYTGTGSLKNTYTNCYAAVTVINGNGVGGIQAITRKTNDTVVNCYFDGQINYKNLEGGVEKNTADMLGTGLQTALETDGGTSGIWVFAEGRYPQLSAFAAPAEGSFLDTALVKAASEVSTAAITFKEGEKSGQLTQFEVNLDFGDWSFRPRDMVQIQSNICNPQYSGSLDVICTHSTGLKKLFRLQVLGDEVRLIENLEDWETYLGAKADSATMGGHYKLNFPGGACDFAGLNPDRDTSLPFTGSLDGNNQKIENLSLPLFEKCIDSDIKDLSLSGNIIETKENQHLGMLCRELIGNEKYSIVNCHAVGSVINSFCKPGTYYTGGLIGYVHASDLNGSRNNQITDCTVKGKVSGAKLPEKSSYILSTGGLIGTVEDNAEISNCRTYVEVTGYGDQIGGLIGRAGEGSDVNTPQSTIYGCSASGSVTCGDGYGGSGIGGLIGYSRRSITQCYANCKVTGGYNNTGGLIGEALASISDSYATGYVAGRNYVGGLVGSLAGNTASVALERCYSSAIVADNGKSGAFIGTADTALQTKDQIKDCYYDKQMAGVPKDISNRTGEVEIAAGMLTTAMTGKSFGNFNVENRWTIQNGMYPVLTAFPAADLDMLTSALPIYLDTAEDGTVYETTGKVQTSFLLPEEIAGRNLNWSVYEGTARIDNENRFTFEKSDKNILRVRIGDSSYYKQFQLITRLPEDGYIRITTLGEFEHYFSTESGNASEETMGGKYILDFPEGELDIMSLSIGSTALPFTGEIEGNHQTLISRFNPVFTAVRGAVIKNLSIEGEGKTVRGNSDTGLLVSSVLSGESTIIENCHVRGSVEVSTPSSDNIYYCGGLIGYAQGTEAAHHFVINSSVDVTVKGASYAGGLIGRGDYVNIQNCSVSGVLTGTDYVGGLIGYGGNVELSACYSAAEKISGTNYAGGLGGYLKQSIVNKCFSGSEVAATGNYAGGAAGCVSDTALRDSYAVGIVDGAEYTGGLIGMLEKGSSAHPVVRCFASGRNLSSAGNSGGLIGAAESVLQLSYLQECYYDRQMTGMERGIGNYSNKYTEGKNTAEMTSGSLFANDAWYCEASMYPQLSVIRNSSAAASDTSAVFALAVILNGEDISADWKGKLTYPAELGTWVSDRPEMLLLENGSGTVSSDYKDNIAEIKVIVTENGMKKSFSICYKNSSEILVIHNAEEWNDYCGNNSLNTSINFRKTIVLDFNETGGIADFSTVNFSNEAFCGILYGNNQIITGLSQALFNSLSNAQIYDLTLEGDIGTYTPGSSVKGKGIVAAQINGGNPTTIKNCLVRGNLDAGTSRDYSAGGLIGNIIAGTGERHIIENCISEVNVTNYENTGGLVGFARGTDFISCRADGVTVSGEEMIGGLIGSGSDSSFYNCYAYGTVSAKSDAGGLAGQVQNCLVEGCFSLGDHSLGNSSGGLIGHAESSSQIVNCYSSGQLHLGITSGGLIGIVQDSQINTCYVSAQIKIIRGKTTGAVFGDVVNTTEAEGMVKECFFDKQIVGIQNGIGSGRFDPEVKGITTLGVIQNQAFAGADWSLKAGQYPQLTTFVSASDDTYRESARVKAVSEVSSAALQFDPAETADEVRSMFYLSEVSGKWTTKYTDNLDLSTPGRAVPVLGGEVILTYSWNQTQKEFIFTIYGQCREISNFDEWDQYLGSGATEASSSAHYSLKKGGNFDFSRMKESAGTKIPFSGMLDGNGETIYGLQVPLFQNVQSAELKDITVQGEITYEFVSSMNSDQRGLLASYASTGSRITDCHASGKITLLGEASMFNGCHTGGLIGYLDGRAGTCYLTGCTSSVNISGKTKLVGGLIGYSYYAEVVDCHATGSVTNALQECGGLIGESLNSKISDCSASGKVEGNLYVGGLVGYSRDDEVYRRCYADTTIIGSGDGPLGGLIGYQNGSAGVSECFANARIRANYNSSTNSIGGLIGHMDSRERVDNCYANVKIQINNGKDIGGLAGSIASTTASIRNCYTTGYISGTDTVGGFAGRIDVTTTAVQMENCYSTVTILKDTGDCMKGAFAGRADGVTPESYFVSCYFDRQMSGLENGVGGVNQDSTVINGMVTGDMLGSGLTSVFGEVNWSFQENRYPQLKHFVSSDGSAKYRETATVSSELSVVPIILAQDTETTGNVSSAFELGTAPGSWSVSPSEGLDLTLEGTAVPLATGQVILIYKANNGLTKEFWLNISAGKRVIKSLDDWKRYFIENPERGAELVAYELQFEGGACDFTGLEQSAFDNQATPFQGILYGNNQTITGLSAPLFGFLANAHIENLNLETNPEGIQSGKDDRDTGILAKRVISGTKTEIDNCHVTGKIISLRTEIGSTGGMIGSINSTQTSRTVIQNCSADIVLEGYQYCGGLIGEARYCYVNNCYVNGSVYGTYTGIGGLIGAGYGSEIENCYVNGSVWGEVDTGGLIGTSSATKISSCYTTGCVNTMGGFTRNIGGLAGSASVNANYPIKNCYSSARIQAKEGITSVRGVVGSIASSPYITNCYYDLQMAGLDTDTPDGIGTRGMLGNSLDTRFDYDGRPASEVWSFTEGCYPQLEAFAGEDKSEASRLSSRVSAESILLEADESTPDQPVYEKASGISRPFQYDSALSGTWKAEPSQLLSLSGGTASPLKGGAVTLTYSEGTYKKVFAFGLSGELETISIRNLEDWERYLGKYATTDTLKQRYKLEFENQTCDFSDKYIPDSMNYGNIFSGILDGNRQTITGITRPLFYTISGGEISNLSIRDADITGVDLDLGILAASISGDRKTIIDGCHVSGRLYSSEDVYIGGLVAMVTGPEEGGHEIRNCSAVVDIEGHSGNGGLAGEVSGNVTIENCFTAGRVKGKASPNGGFAASITDAKTTIRNCYSTVFLEVPYYSGGFIGSTSSPSVCTNCFYDAQATGAYGGVGRKDVDSIQRLYTGQMTGDALKTYLGDAWVYDENLYPQLANVAGTSTSILSCIPLNLYHESDYSAYDTITGITDNFTVPVAAGGKTITWESGDDEIVAISPTGNSIFQLRGGKTVLIARIDGIKREIGINVRDGDFVGIEKNVILPHTDAVSPEWSTTLLDGVDAGQYSSWKVLKTDGQFKSGDIYHPATAESIQTNYSFYGAANANSKLNLSMLTGAGETDLSSDGTISGITGIKLYNAAAYNCAEDQYYRVLFRADLEKVLAINVTIPAVTSKQLDITVPVPKEISLSPGIRSKAYTEEWEIKNDMAYPLDISLAAVLPGETAGEDGVSLSLIAPTIAIRPGEDLITQGVKLGLSYTEGEGEESKETCLYYNPSEGAEQPHMNLGAGRAQKFKYFLEYSPYYTGSKRHFSYQIKYNTQIPESDVEAGTIQTVEPAAGENTPGMR
ncbi:GLUG motif-containing protein [Anaerolentibacter hominis]|uniref:GLUG motif-containing protein n=1 Tax=Anaerolentibacter hominis TaxID=3079009 RepID=UPI0031B839DA